jgi:hypothetical protein
MLIGVFESNMIGDAGEGDLGTSDLTPGTKFLNPLSLFAKAGRQKRT